MMNNSELNQDVEQESKWKKFFLKSWQPVPTWTSTIIIFAALGNKF